MCDPDLSCIAPRMLMKLSCESSTVACSHNTANKSDANDADCMPADPSIGLWRSFVMLDSMLDCGSLLVHAQTMTIPFADSLMADH